MKNRTKEYWALIGELNHPPEALENSVERARKRVRRTSPLRRLAAPAASLAAIAASFVLLVNVFPTFALACSGLPIIRELTAAVAFSPSLSAAVAHDYVQYIGQSKTADGLTVRLEYAIVDPAQAVFFYSTDSDVRFYTSPNILDALGEPVGGYATSSGSYDGENGLHSMTLSFTNGESRLPEHFTLNLFLKPLPERDQATVPAAAPDSGGTDDWTDPREDPDTLCFSFDVALDPTRIHKPQIVPVDRWLELNGQRILVDRLELFPTRTVLCLGEDSTNTAWLTSLKFWFEDEAGIRYDNTDGVLTASGSTDSHSYLTYYFQSFYYDLPKRLTLKIDKAEWRDKDVPLVRIDLNAKTASGLPEGVEIASITRNDQNAVIELLSPPVRSSFPQTFNGTYWDPDGGEHSWNHWAGGSRYSDEGEEIAVYELYYLDDYPWDTVELELNYTDTSVYETPIAVPLLP